VVLSQGFDSDHICISRQRSRCCRLTQKFTGLQMVYFVTQICRFCGPSQRAYAMEASQIWRARGAHYLLRATCLASANIQM
jgi:hypothetical protein